jgi:hypothetical protein
MLGIPFEFEDDAVDVHSVVEHAEQAEARASRAYQHTPKISSTESVKPGSSGDVSD